jgi:hypothetical protein
LNIFSTAVSPCPSTETSFEEQKLVQYNSKFLEKKVVLPKQ